LISSHNIKDRIKNFKELLKSNEASYLVRKNIIFGSCAVIDDDQYLELRSNVAKQFSIHPNEVLVVGSAKLGFSTAPHKRYRGFSDSSDIDVVIVNSKLFDDIWYLVYQSWKNKVLWECERDFQKYMFRGWLRPDFFPASNSMAISKAWWEYFRELTASGRFGQYKLSGAIYKDWNYIEQYQSGAIAQCKENLELTDED